LVGLQLRPNGCKWSSSIVGAAPEAQNGFHRRGGATKTCGSIRLRLTFTDLPPLFKKMELLCRHCWPEPTSAPPLSSPAQRRRRRGREGAGFRPPPPARVRLRAAPLLSSPVRRRRQRGREGVGSRLPPLGLAFGASRELLWTGRTEAATVRELRDGRNRCRQGALREGRWERLDPSARRWDEKVPTWGGCGVRRMRCGEGLWHREDAPRVHLTVGNRNGYCGNRSYRSGSVRKKLGYGSLTEPSKPYQTALFGLPVSFTGLPDRFCRFRKPLRQRFFEPWMHRRCG
jgi:hypothetical protein